MGPRKDTQKETTRDRTQPYVTPVKGRGFQYYKEKVNNIDIPNAVVIMDTDEFLDKVKDGNSFTNVEIDGTLVSMEFKTTETNKKLVSLFVCGFVEPDVDKSEILALCTEYQTKLRSSAAFETRKELFTCTVWGEHEDKCTLQVGKAYKFCYIRKARNYEGTANFDCLIQNICPINF